MPWGLGEGNDRGICALLEYRKRTEAPVWRRLFSGLPNLPAAMISAPVATMRPHDDHAWRVVVARSEDDHRSGTVTVGVGVRIARVIRSANEKLSGEVRISKTQRNTDAGLSLRDPSREAKQECDDNEYAFHGSSLARPD